MSNLDLWERIERTDPNHVKTITGKSYAGTSPRPYYLIRKATETFGPIGIGWGYSIISDRIEDGSDGDKLHIARVKVWYEWEGKRGEVEHIGATPFSGKRASGKSFIDEDSAKKSVTDALVKALSMIGFAGDIFMGRYDDSKYVADTREEFEQAKPLSTDTMVAAEKLLETAAGKGTAALKGAWLKLPPSTRELFGSRAPDRFKVIATRYDEGKAA
jgi:hypothetical protein